MAENNEQPTSPEACGLTDGHVAPVACDAKGGVVASGDCAAARGGAGASAADACSADGAPAADAHTVAIVTVSDRSAAGEREDAAGPALRELLQGEGYEVVGLTVVSDDRPLIEAAIADAAAAGVALCVTTGGTGLGPRDVTPEATAAVCDRMVPGIGEAMRAASAAITPFAWLSRATAGTLGRTLVVNVPGSPRAAVENLSAVLKPVAHGIKTLRATGPLDCASERADASATTVQAAAADLTGCRYALFDFDCTLADTAPGIVEAAAEPLREWGMGAEEMGDVARLVGPALPGAFRLVYGVSVADDAELTARYRARYEKLGPESYPLFPGMAQLLDDLRSAGWKLGVATSKRQHRCEAMLDALDVRDRFDVICGQQDGVKDKPTLIGRALERLGATADRAVMVGDRKYDVEGAQANGIACVGVHFGSTPRSELERAGAAAVVDSVPELERVLLGAGGSHASVAAAAPASVSEPASEPGSAPEPESAPEPTHKPASEARLVVAPPVSERSCILFDFDGTLADTKPAIVDTARKVLREWGMSDEEIGDPGRLVGPPFPAAFSIVYGMSEEDAAEVTRRYRAIYTTLGLETHLLFDGMAELLGDLKAAGRRLAVTTSKREEMAHEMLAENGVEQLFGAIVGQTDPTRADKATLVGDTLEALGCGADDAVMVGDRFYDVEGAAANGVPCVGVYLGGTAPAGELEQAGAAACAHSVDELRRVLLG